MVGVAEQGRCGTSLQSGAWTVSGHMTSIVRMLSIVTSREKNRGCGEGTLPYDRVEPTSKLFRQQLYLIQH